MAGYYLYTLDGGVFTQLTTTPTRAQGLVLADHLMQFLDDEDDEDEYEEDEDTVPAPGLWPRDRDALANCIVERLARPDWYSDLSFGQAVMWDNVVHALQGEAGQAIGIDFQCSDYESIYWDCAEEATRMGATMMAEPAFGNGGFRFFGKPDSEYSHPRMYTLYLPDKARLLLAQLEAVEPHFRALPDGEGTPREQFFEGLLPVVRDAVTARRVLWVQTDT